MQRSETSAEAAISAIGTPKYVLAAEVRIAPSDFARIIRGRQVPTSAQARRIADRLGVRVDAIFDEVAS